MTDEREGCPFASFFDANRMMGWNEADGPYWHGTGASVEDRLYEAIEGMAELHARIAKMEATVPAVVPLEPIATAPTDGTLVPVWAAPREGLPGFWTVAAYHPYGGWCVDELREVTHWIPVPEGLRIVPREPTDAMVERALRERKRRPNYAVGGQEKQDALDLSNVAAILRAAMSEPPA